MPALPNANVKIPVADLPNILVNIVLTLQEGRINFTEACDRYLAVSAAGDLPPACKTIEKAALALIVLQSAGTAIGELAEVTENALGANHMHVLIECLRLSLNHQAVRCTCMHDSVLRLIVNLLHTGHHFMYFWIFINL